MSIQKTRTSNEKVRDNVRIFKRGAWWHANIQIDGRQKRVALGTTNKVAARRKAEELADHIAIGGLPERRKQITTQDAVDVYLGYSETEGRARKTLVKYRRVLSQFVTLCSKRGVDLLGRVTLAELDAYRAARKAEGRQDKTVYNEAEIIRQLAKYAASRKLTDSDVLVGARLRKPKPTRQPCWSPEEVRRIIDLAEEPARSCFVLLAETGMRVGELIHLTWEDIDPDRGLLHIRAKAGWRPKTGDERSVPINDAVRSVLERLPRRSPWVVNMPATRKYPVLNRPISDRWLLYQIKKIVKQLGLEGHLHTFRHSFISNALARGIPESVVREWVGHIDPNILKLYTHVMDDVSRNAMQQLGSMVDPGPASEPPSAKSAG